MQERLRGASVAALVPCRSPLLAAGAAALAAPTRCPRNLGRSGPPQLAAGNGNFAGPAQVTPSPVRGTPRTSAATSATSAPDTGGFVALDASSPAPSNTAWPDVTGWSTARCRTARAASSSAAASPRSAAFRGRTSRTSRRTGRSTPTGRPSVELGRERARAVGHDALRRRRVHRRQRHRRATTPPRSTRRPARCATWDPSFDGPCTRSPCRARPCTAGGSFTHVNGRPCATGSLRSTPRLGVATAWDPNLEQHRLRARAVGLDAVRGRRLHRHDRRRHAHPRAPLRRQPRASRPAGTRIRRSAADGVAVDGAKVYVGGNFVSSTGASPATAWRASTRRPAPRRAGTRT